MFTNTLVHITAYYVLCNNENNQEQRHMYQTLTATKSNSKSVIFETSPINCGRLRNLMYSMILLGPSQLRVVYDFMNNISNQ